MSVYVDTLIVWGGDEAPRCFRHKPSCHMYADSLEELHAFALRVGLKRSWFQDSPSLQHYDLTEGRRMVAVRLGAIEQDRRQSVEKWREIRKASTVERMQPDVSPGPTEANAVPAIQEEKR